MQYYVIKDKNTGLYFRGKGVNRWGKHLNQASIYRVKAMAEHTLEELSWRGEQGVIVHIKIIELVGEESKEISCDGCEHETDDSGYCIECCMGDRYTKKGDKNG